MESAKYIELTLLGVAYPAMALPPFLISFEVFYTPLYNSTNLHRAQKS